MSTINERADALSSSIREWSSAEREDDEEQIEEEEPEVEYPFHFSARVWSDGTREGYIVSLMSAIFRDDPVGTYAAEEVAEARERLWK